MHKQRFIIAIIATILATVSVTAQDDTYYSPQNDQAQPNTDYTDGYGNNTSNNRAQQYDNPDHTTTETDANGNTYITNNYYYDDDDYDYRYSCNLRRYYAPTYGVNFWGGYYTDYYYYSYDPWLWGVNINMSSGWGWGWNRPWWRRGVVVYDPWYDPWYGYSSWGCNVVVYDPYWYQPWGWNNHCYNNGWYSNGWGHHHGNGYWNGYGNGYANGYWDGYYDGYNDSWYGGSCWNSPWRMDKQSPTGNNGSGTYQQSTSYVSGQSLSKRNKMTSTELSTVDIPREGIQKPLSGNPQKNPSAISNHNNAPVRANESTTKTPQSTQPTVTDSRSNAPRFDSPNNEVRSNGNSGTDAYNQRSGNQQQVAPAPQGNNQPMQPRKDTYSEQRYNNRTEQPAQQPRQLEQYPPRKDSYNEERYKQSDQQMQQRQRENVQHNQQTDRQQQYRDRENVQPRQPQQQQPKTEQRYEKQQRSEPRYEQRQSAPQQRVEPRNNNIQPRGNNGGGGNGSNGNPRNRRQ